MFLVSPALAQGIIHDEAVDGDLSGVSPSPTAVVLGLGTNTIVGSLGPAGGVGGATNGQDADIFTFTLGAGQTVTSIVTTRSGPGSQSFIGYSNSIGFAAFTDAATLSTALDSGSLFSNGTPSPNALAGGIPVTLGAGDHTFILQETVTTNDYTISFEVASVVPEPSSAALLGGLAMVGFIRRRRR